jgi:hypothetical protein
MPMRAMSFDQIPHPSIPSLDIYLAGNDLEMVWVNAASRSACVIYFHANGDFPNQELIDNSVCAMIPTFKPNPAVT